MGKGYVDKRLGMYRDAGDGTDDGGQVNWDDLRQWIENTYPWITEALNWEDFITNFGDELLSWLTENYPYFSNPLSWEEFLSLYGDNIQSWLEEIYPYLNNPMTWEDFITNFGDDLKTWLDENYTTINSPISWEDFITNFGDDLLNWLNENYTLNGYSWEDFISNFGDDLRSWLEENYPFINNPFDWNEWITNNGDLLEEWIRNVFPQIDQFITWEDFITQFGDDLRSWLEENYGNIGDNITWEDFITNLGDDLRSWLEENYPFINDADYWEEFITKVINNYFSDGALTRLISASVTWLQLLEFWVANLIYEIVGVLYSAPDQKVILEPADPIFPRKDVIVADRNSNVYSITGQPAPNPNKPVVPFGLIEITVIDIAAGATTPSGVTNSVIYDERDSEEWTASSQSDVNVTVDLESTVKPGNATKHINIAASVPDSEIDVRTHYIGEYYQGGVIFWLSRDGKSGLIASTTDQGIEKYEILNDASPYGVGSIYLGIGQGRTNTDLLEAHLHNAARYAVRLCVGFTKDGYSDWFFPSLEELQRMHFYRDKIGGFASTYYWSSTEIDWDSAYSFNFSNGNAKSSSKDRDLRVRAIRAFDDEDVPTTEPVTQFSPTGTLLNFQAPEVTEVSGGVLSFMMDSSLPWFSDTAIVIEAKNSGLTVGTVVISENSYGYRSDVPGYQTLNIPVNDFGVMVSKVTDFTFRLINTWPNNIVLNIDLIVLQTGIELPPEDNPVKIGDWIEDMTFDYMDAADGNQYIIDPCASFSYRIIEAVFLTDAGTMNVNVSINGGSVTGLASCSANNTVQKFNPTDNNLVVEDDQVTINLSGLAGAAEIIGKLKIVRT